MPLAQLTSVEKFFSRNIVLCGINLTIERGELIAVLGTKGAGKTTLLRLLVGLLGLSSGELYIAGSPYNRLSEAPTRKLLSPPPSAPVQGRLQSPPANNPLSPPAAPVQGRLQGPPAKSKFLAVNWSRP